VCISAVESWGRGEVRVGVLLCRDSEVSFLCVQHYSLDPNSYYLALCVYQLLEAGVEGGG
jgi:hypothetical protein